MNRGLLSLLFAALFTALATHAVHAQPCPPISVVDPSGAPGDEFGTSIAIDGDTMVVGAPLAAEDMGSASVYRWIGGSWVYEATLAAFDGASNDLFGTSVAISGDTIVVGAPGDNGPFGATQFGSAHVFVHDGSDWQQVSRLVAPDGAADDRFGSAVAISGETIAIGAPGDNVAGLTDNGSVYIFERVGSDWAFQSPKLIASDDASFDAFGTSLDLDKDTLIVGSPRDDIGGFNDQGSAYVFVRSGFSTWTQQAKLTAFDEDNPAGDRFGQSVAIDGDYAAIGAWLKDIGSGANRGSAYVFVRSGTSWSQQDELQASPSEEEDRFGRSIDISGDTVLVGAYSVDGIDGGFDQGAAFAFTRNGTVWTQQKKMMVPNAASEDFLGWSVALDGDHAAVGAKGHNSGRGQAWVFSRSGGLWIEHNVDLTAFDGSSAALFGVSVDVDGDTMIIGASSDDTPDGVDAGAAYIYVRDGGVWTLQQKITAPDGAPGDRFGRSVAIDGDRVVIGAPGDDVTGRVDQGSAYVFDRSGTTWNFLSPKLTHGFPNSGDAFGFSVSISGDWILVGAPFDDGSQTGIRSGTVWFFEGPNATLWEGFRLPGINNVEGKRFGLSVDIFGDNAVAGAPGSAEAGNEIPGSILFFIRTPADPSVWSTDGLFNHPSGEPADLFGHSVAIQDGLAAVGAHLDDVSGNVDQGSVHTYFRSFTQWNYGIELTASDGAPADWFGISVDVAENRVLAGASFDDAPLSNAGAAYLFAFENLPGWGLTERAKFSGSQFGGILGRSVALEGEVVFLGAPFEDERGAVHIRNGERDCQPLVRNETTGVFYDDLGDAVLDSTPGDPITATPAIWGERTGLNSFGPGQMLQSTSALRMNSDYTLSLNQESSLTSITGGDLEVYGELFFGFADPGNLQISADSAFFGHTSSLRLGNGSTLSFDTDLECAITDNSDFQMIDGALRFDGTGSPQTMEVMSTDIGSNDAGYDPSLAGHFPIGTLHIASGSTLNLVDEHDNDNAGQLNCEAMYVVHLEVESGATLNTNGCKIYCSSAIIFGSVDNLANVIFLPIACPGDVNSDGSVDLADLNLVLGNFGTATTTGDANGDGNVDLADLNIVLGSFGTDC